MAVTARRRYWRCGCVRYARICHCVQDTPAGYRLAPHCDGGAGGVSIAFDEAVSDQRCANAPFNRRQQHQPLRDAVSHASTAVLRYCGGVFALQASAPSRYRAFPGAPVACVSPHRNGSVGANCGVIIGFCEGRCVHIDAVSAVSRVPWRERSAPSPLKRGNPLSCRLAGNLHTQRDVANAPERFILLLISVHRPQYLAIGVSGMPSGAPSRCVRFAGVWLFRQQYGLCLRRYRNGAFDVCSG